MYIKCTLLTYLLYLSYVLCFQLHQNQQYTTVDTESTIDIYSEYKLRQR